MREPTDEFIYKIKQIPNSVIHVINGIFTENDFEKLKDHDLKVLILGYKMLRRGTEYMLEEMEEVVRNQQWLWWKLRLLPKHFKVISFDNLAIEQLDVRRIVSPEDWEQFYMGDDGKYTFYIDLVEGCFGKNSLATERYPIMDSVDSMFEKIVNTQGE